MVPRLLLSAPRHECAFWVRPKLLTTLRGYSRADFVADAVAGLTVGIVALPLAMALAIAAGLKPEVGIFTAIIGGFCISAFGGSRVQIGGPAEAFVPLLVPIVAAHGPQGLVVCSLMAGVILFALGAARLGVLIKYIPFPVVTGFTSGIAIIILSTQLGDFFGLSAPLPAHVVGKARELVTHFQPHWPTLALALAGTLAIWFWPARWGAVAARLHGGDRGWSQASGDQSARRLWSPMCAAGFRRSLPSSSAAGSAIPTRRTPPLHRQIRRKSGAAAPRDRA